MCKNYFSCEYFFLFLFFSKNKNLGNCSGKICLESTIKMKKKIIWFNKGERLVECSKRKRNF